MCTARTHTHIPFPPFPLHNETGRDYRSNVMVMICVISKDTRSPLAKHEFWKMPFDKKISSKHRTLKCHFTPLTSSGTGVKQQTGSKAGRRIQWTVHCWLPRKRTVHKCFSFGCFIINTMPSRRPIRVQMSSLDMTSVLLAAVECWVTYKAHL